MLRAALRPPRSRVADLTSGRSGALRFGGCVRSWSDDAHCGFWNLATDGGRAWAEPRDPGPRRAACAGQRRVVGGVDDGRCASGDSRQGETGALIGHEPVCLWRAARRRTGGRCRGSDNALQVLHCATGDARESTGHVSVLNSVLVAGRTRAVVEPRLDTAGLDLATGEAQASVLATSARSSAALLLPDGRALSWSDAPTSAGSGTRDGETMANCMKARSAAGCCCWIAACRRGASTAPSASVPSLAPIQVWCSTSMRRDSWWFLSARRTSVGTCSAWIHFLELEEYSRRTPHPGFSRTAAPLSERCQPRARRAETSRDTDGCQRGDGLRTA